MMYQLTTRINQDMKFVHVQTWKVYEHYKINNKSISNQLGFFNTSFDYVHITKKSFDDRRGNFQGYKLKAMTEECPPFISIDISKSNYDEDSKTYDVTNTVWGLHQDLFLEMQKNLNFSATVHKRKDGKWGPTTVLENGSISAAGIVESLTSGFAEMIVAQ